MRLEAVDKYIDKQADFAQEILSHFRGLVHSTNEQVTEAIKWGMPFFLYDGKIFGHMAGFKKHCAIGFWKYGKAVPEEELKASEAMGHLGRIGSMSDLPEDEVLREAIRDAIRFSQEEAPQTKKKKPVQKKFVLPDALKEALGNNDKARLSFEKFTYSQQKEYADWISDAKTDATVQKRLSETISNLEEGKTRHWKYQRKK